MNKIKAVIFDLDGVICSTDHYHFLAWKSLADRLGIPFDEKINAKLRGVSRIQSLEIILGDRSENYSAAEKNALAEEKNKIYKQYLTGMTPKDLSDDVRNTLIELRQRGYLLAVGSSSKNTQQILKQIGLEHFFDAVADGTQITKSKPDPEVFLLAAELLKTEPKNAVVIEDAEAGVAAAKKGGFRVVGLRNEENDPQSDISIKHLRDLLEFL